MKEFLLNLSPQNEKFLWLFLTLIPNKPDANLFLKTNLTMIFLAYSFPYLRQFLHNLDSFRQAYQTCFWYISWLFIFWVVKIMMCSKQLSWFLEILQKGFYILDLCISAIWFVNFLVPAFLQNLQKSGMLFWTNHDFDIPRNIKSWNQNLATKGTSPGSEYTRIKFFRAVWSC